MSPFSKVEMSPFVIVKQQLPHERDGLHHFRKSAGSNPHRCAERFITRKLGEHDRVSIPPAQETWLAEGVGLIKATAVDADKNVIYKLELNSYQRSDELLPDRKEDTRGSQVHIG